MNRNKQNCGGSKTIRKGQGETAHRGDNINVRRTQDLEVLLYKRPKREQNERHERPTKEGD